MNKTEFYTFNNEVWYRTGEETKRLTEFSPLVDDIISEMTEFYPEAYNALSKEFRKIELVAIQRFRIAQRFIKCNFSNIDNVWDIQGNGKMVFEHVQCPLRGECPLENIVCNPSFNSMISKREMEVLHLLYQGVSREKIAERLYLSEHTVRNHIRNAFVRIGVHDEREFIDYANRNTLFKDERIK